MTASTAYSPARVSNLTDTQLAELNRELLTELRRLTPGSTLGARPHDVRTDSRIRLILDALKRIRAGVYGTCLACQTPIAFDRLSVIPETKTCVRCS
jgi:Prokaryotic dksA/traR C4-type zinc finger